MPAGDAFGFLLKSLGLAIEGNLQAVSYAGDGGSNEFQAAGKGDPDSPWGITCGLDIHTMLVESQDGYALHHPEAELGRFADHTVREINKGLELLCLQRH